MAEGLHEIDHGAVLILALERPERRNSMDLSVAADALDRAAGNENVNAIMLQGYSHVFGAGSTSKH